MISAGVYLFGCIIYWFWATGELQPWANKSSNTNDTTVENKQKTPEPVTYVAYANEGLEMNE